MDRRDGQRSRDDFALGLIDATRERGFTPRTAIMDKGYDNGPIHDGYMDRDICPVTPLRKTGRVLAGDHHAPCCEHGEWTFAGTDYKRQATKWRCPTGECTPKSRWTRPTGCTRSSRAPGALGQALQEPWGRRARVRTTQARMGAVPAPGARA